MDFVAGPDTESSAEGAMEDRRSKLMAAARQYASSIQSQPGVVGIVLYGSLALGDPSELTPFSDVDLALILDREPPAHWAEHRLVQGIKLDVSLIHMGWLREQVGKQPEQLDQSGWVHNVLIKSFLLGNAETILFDPTGEIVRTRRKLNELTTYPTMALVGTRRWLREIENQYLASARQRFEHGRFPEAMDQCASALRTLEAILLTLACTKKRQLAADRMGMPQFYRAASELRHLLAPRASAARAYWQAAHELWGYTYRGVCEPIRSELLRAGVSEPDRLELIGDYPLFWAGNRLHEFGRLVAEVNLSFTWSQYELDRGNFCDAPTRLWACDSKSTIGRCEGLAAALKDMGYDVAPIVIPFLEDHKLRRLGAEVDEAGKEALLREVSSADAERAVRLAEELRQMVDKVLAPSAGGAAPDS